MLFIRLNEFFIKKINEHLTTSLSCTVTEIEKALSSRLGILETVDGLSSSMDELAISSSETSCSSDDGRKNCYQELIYLQLEDTKQHFTDVDPSIMLDVKELIILERLKQQLLTNCQNAIDMLDNFDNSRKYPQITFEETIDHWHYIKIKEALDEANILLNHCREQPIGSFQTEILLMAFWFVLEHFMEFCKKADNNRADANHASGFMIDLIDGDDTPDAIKIMNKLIAEYLVKNLYDHGIYEAHMQYRKTYPWSYSLYDPVASSQKRKILLATKNQFDNTGLVPNQDVNWQALLEVPHQLSQSAAPLTPMYKKLRSQRFDRLCTSLHYSLGVEASLKAPDVAEAHASCRL